MLRLSGNGEFGIITNYHRAYIKKLEGALANHKDLLIDAKNPSNNTTYATITRLQKRIGITLGEIKELKGQENGSVIQGKKVEVSFDINQGEIDYDQGDLDSDQGDLNISN